MQITNIAGDPALDSLRYAGTEAITKIGILPFRRAADGELSFLVAAPLPKRDAVQLPLAIARGTRQIEIERADGSRYLDDDGRWLGDGRIIRHEGDAETALREAAEELGLRQEDIYRLYDCGPLWYKNYGLRMFLADSSWDARLDSAPDSREVCWISLADSRQLIETGVFNAAYRPLLEGLAQMASRLS